MISFEIIWKFLVFSVAFVVFCVVLALAFMIVSTALAKSSMHSHLSWSHNGFSSPSRYLPV